jgi:hypothetical protein
VRSGPRPPGESPGIWGRTHLRCRWRRPGWSAQTAHSRRTSLEGDGARSASRPPRVPGGRRACWHRSARASDFGYAITVPPGTRITPAPAGPAADAPWPQQLAEPDTGRSRATRRPRHLAGRSWPAPWHALGDAPPRSGIHGHRADRRLDVGTSGPESRAPSRRSRGSFGLPAWDHSRYCGMADPPRVHRYCPVQLAGP